MPRRRAPHSSQKPKMLPVMLAIIATVLVMLLASFAFQGTLGGSTTNRSNSQVDFVANDFAGKTVHLSDYRGKPVLVNLWASWCPPCRAEMSDLIKFYNDHQADGLVFLSVNSQDNLASAQQFVREKQMTFAVLFDPNGDVGNIFRTDGLPDTFLIDRAGNLRFSSTGQISPSILEQRVAPLLSQ